MVSQIDPYKRRLALNASEIQELTGWPDSMVQDYLNILEDLLSLTDVINSDVIGRPKQFFQIDTDADPPALPDEADDAVSATIRCRRSDGRYEDYVYTP